MSEYYENPLITRYASKDMARVFSDETKFKTWRKLWVVLAESEMELGIDITKEQIDELKEYQDKLNLSVAKEREKEVRHDVMSHVYAYGTQAQKAKPIIHLGATSCYVGDNTDVLVMQMAMEVLEKKLLSAINLLKNFCLEYKDMPTLGFTHYQPAQLTTVGKRATLWLQDLVMDYEEFCDVKKSMKLRGVKGTTGTQASFLTLFDNDHQKVKELEKRVINKLGFDQAYGVTGQTYPRKFDSRVLNLLSSIAQSAYKFSNDIRLLQNLKEIEEPFNKKQIGSSAMAYKRNPMRTERIGSLSRFVIANTINPAITAATQWFERTLDDSANKRLSVPQGFLAVDAVLLLVMNVLNGLVVYPKVIETRINSELPFMATETILMEAVRLGGDRQELHERIRVHSMEAAKCVKMEGKPNDLIERIAADDIFPFEYEDLNKIMDPKNFIGRAVEQVDEFINEYVTPILKENQDKIFTEAKINV